MKPGEPGYVAAQAADTMTMGCSCIVTFVVVMGVIMALILAVGSLFSH